MANMGRPRVASTSPTGMGTRNDILHAGAELFCTIGYGSTSTHALAAAAGIRQASLYHHFAGKQEVLLELLVGTVQPSLDIARTLLRRTEPPEARLWALCVSDVMLLSGGEANIGSLYLLPELGDERFAEFHRRRLELESAYERLINRVVAPPAPGSDSPATDGATALVMSLVESVILQRRRRPDLIGEHTAHSIADAALKTLDVAAAALATTREQGVRLLADLR